MRLIASHQISGLTGRPAGLTGRPAGLTGRPRPMWGVWMSYAVAFAYPFIPGYHHMPATVVCALAVATTQWFLPACRPLRTTPLCPHNLALVLFSMQLLIIPMLVALFGASQNTLPHLPSDFAMSSALLVSTVAYLAYCGSVHYYSTPSHRASETGQTTIQTRRRLRVPVILMAAIYSLIGALGFVLFFGNVESYVTYVSVPALRLSHNALMGGTLGGAASTFLRPFLAYAIIMVWSRWVDRRSTARSRPVTIAVTVLALALTIPPNLSFSLNRGQIVAPLIAMLGVYSARVSRIQIKTALAGGVLLLLTVFAFGAYRQSTLTLQGVISDPASILPVIQRSNLINQIQVYGQGPQFLGYMLEQTDYGNHLYWGATLASSLVNPVPVLGKPFRHLSAEYIYNGLIYGEDSGILDQVDSFQWELFMNFHVAGLVGGFWLLGFVICSFQRRFLTASSALDAYNWLLMSMWTLFLVFGSLSVVSQIYVYFFWPIYGYLAFKRALPICLALHKSYFGTVTQSRQLRRLDSADEIEDLHRRWDI